MLCQVSKEVWRKLNVHVLLEKGRIGSIILGSYHCKCGLHFP